MPLVTKPFSNIITFTRASGATWFNSVGVLQGVDFSVTSNTIGTGSKSFTLDATAGVDRYWAPGDTILISDQANSANNMVGTVTSYNASTQVLVCNITSTGGSGTITSWRIGSTMPRFDYDPVTLAAKGLLIEAQRTNICLQSEFSTGVSGTGLVTASTMFGPDGNNVAAAAFGYDGVTTSLLYKVTVALSTQYTISVYVKMDDGGAPVFGSVSATGVNNDFVLVVGNQAGVPTIVTNVGNGLYRVSAVITSTGSNPGNTGVLKYATNSSRTFKTTAWQVELGAFPTSYIPTVASEVTRLSDAASVDTLSPWYNASEGTLYAEYTPYAVTSDSRFASIDANTTANRIMIWGTSGSARTIFDVSAAAVNQASIQTTGTFTTNTTKSAGAYKVNDFAFSVNGAAALTYTSGSIPVATQLVIGSSGGSSAKANAHIRKVAYYPRRLSNAELQALTA